MTLSPEGKSVAYPLAKDATVGFLPVTRLMADLDHPLEDSAARAQMLQKSDEFLRKAIGMQVE